MKRKPKPPKSPGPVLSAKVANDAQAKREQVHDFALPFTAPGTWAKVHAVQISDPSVMMSLPPLLVKQLVEETIEAAEVLAKSEDLIEQFQQYGLVITAHRATCIAGFIDPPLIMSETDRTSPDQVVVDAIHPRDQHRYYEWCQDVLGRAPVNLDALAALEAAQTAAA